MSKDLVKHETNEIIEEKQLIKTLNKLSVAASESVDAYISSLPRLNTMADLSLKILEQEQTIANMEYMDILKLLEVATKFQMQPLEQFTKLFTQMNNFQERLDTIRQADKLDKLAQEIHQARAETKNVDEGTADSEVLDAEIIENIEDIKNLVKNK